VSVNTRLPLPDGRRGAGGAVVEPRRPLPCSLLRRVVGGGQRRGWTATEQVRPTRSGESGACGLEQEEDGCSVGWLGMAGPTSVADVRSDRLIWRVRAVPQRLGTVFRIPLQAFLRYVRTEGIGRGCRCG
jgi:hypothetical protein